MEFAAKIFNTKKLSSRGIFSSFVPRSTFFLIHLILNFLLDNQLWMYFSSPCDNKLIVVYESFCYHFYAIIKLLNFIEQIKLILNICCSFSRSSKIRKRSQNMSYVKAPQYRWVLLLQISWYKGFVTKVRLDFIKNGYYHDHDCIQYCWWSKN